MLAAETTRHKDIEKTPASKALEDSRRALTVQFENGKSLHFFSEAYTEIMDQYFRQSHQNSETGRLLFKKRGAFALLAVGGPGRAKSGRRKPGTGNYWGIEDILNLLTSSSCGDNKKQCCVAHE